MRAVGRDDDAGHVAAGELLDRGGRAVAGALVVHRDEGDRRAAEGEAPGRDHGALGRVTPLRTLARSAGQRRAGRRWSAARARRPAAPPAPAAPARTAACSRCTPTPAPGQARRRAREGPCPLLRSTVSAQVEEVDGAVLDVRRQVGGEGRQLGLALQGGLGLRLPQQDAVDLLAPDRRVRADGVGGQAQLVVRGVGGTRACPACPAGPCRAGRGCRGRAARCSGRRSASCGCCRCRGSRTRRCRRWCAARPRSGCSAPPRCPSPRTPARSAAA